MTGTQELLAEKPGFACRCPPLHWITMTFCQSKGPGREPQCPPLLACASRRIAHLCSRQCCSYAPRIAHSLKRSDEKCRQPCESCCYSCLAHRCSVRCIYRRKWSGMAFFWRSCETLLVEQRPLHLCEPCVGQNSILISCHRKLS